jgi:hypothetical protein
MVCQEAMKACLEKAKEPTSEKMKTKAENEDVPKEEAAVETFGAPKKWYRDWQLAAVCQRNGPIAMVGPRRSWLPAEGWPPMLFLHCAVDTVIKDAVLKDRWSNR